MEGFKTIKIRNYSKNRKRKIRFRQLSKIYTLPNPKHKKGTSNYHVKYCIWSTQWLESFLPDIASQYTTFIEVENNNGATIFFELWKNAENVFYKIPSKIPKQFGKNVIIIKKLISGSPLVESNEIVYPHLEKMIVDLYCDWDKIHPYKNPTFYKFFKKLYSNFSINESKLLRYADRRKKKMVFLKHLQRLKHVNS